MKKVHEFQDAWRWPERVERFVREQTEGKSLHICAGQSEIGDVTVDMDRSNNPTVQADMNNLPFRDLCFDTVIIDPPWKSVNIFDRHGLFYECVRVTQKRGKIIHNATWVPESNQCEKVGEFRRQDIPFGNASIISIFERYKNQTGLDDFIENEG